jgi:putative transposase
LRRYGRSGHLWQGRFKSFPIQQDLHLLTVMRYVERNPVRAKLVRRAEDWPWSSFGARLSGVGSVPLATKPVELPLSWAEWVNEAQPTEEVATLGTTIRCGTPYGDDGWRETVARSLGLPSRARPPGRPRK